MTRFITYLNTNVIMRITFFIFLFAFSIKPSFSQQYPVQVNVQVIQPVTPYLPELMGGIYGDNKSTLAGDINDKLRVTVINTGSAGKNIKLYGKIERLSPAPMKISLRPEYAPPRPVTLGPNQMITPNKDLLNQAFGYFTKSDVMYDNTSPEELRGDGINYKLPEGTYRICISAFDYDKPGMSGPLSAPGTGCATFVICYTAAAPQLILPISTIGHSNTEFKEFKPNSSQLQFQWTPPSSTCGVPLGFVSYDLEIKRIFEGQTIKDAVFNPAVFERTNIPTNTFILDTMRYPFVFEKGQRYIVRVKANHEASPTSPVSIDNNGYSQIAGFLYRPEAGQPTQPGGVASRKDTLPKVETVISGRLNYRFAEDPDGRTFPLANQRVYIKREYAKIRKDADGITHFDPLTQTERNSMPPFPEVLDGQLVETDQEGKFTITAGMTDLDRSGVVAGSDWQNMFSVEYHDGVQLIPKTGNPQIPAALENLEGKLVRMYKVVVANPFFKPAEDYIQIFPGGERNLNDVVLEANSYELRVNVREEIAGKKGKYVEGARINLYRLKSNKNDAELNIPYFEGDLMKRSDWKERDDKVLIASKTTPKLTSASNNPDDYSVSFPRLFKHPGGEKYDYIVQLENGEGTMRLAPANPIMIPPVLPITKVSSPWTQLLSHTGKSAVQQSVSSQTSHSPDDFVALSGPNAGSMHHDISVAEQRPMPVQNTGSVEYESVWKNWAYNGSPDVANLTLKRELVEPPRSIVTGKLEYKYKDDPSIPARPYANMPVKLMVFYLTKPKEDAAPQPTSGSLDGFSLEGDDNYYNQAINTYANQDKQQFEGYGISSKGMHSAARFRGFNDNGKIVQTVYTDAAGNFTFDFENIDSTMRIEEGEWFYDDAGATERRPYKMGSIVRVLRVVPSMKSFTAPDNNIAVQPWSDYNAGTLTSYVRTFNLDVGMTTPNTGGLLETNDIPVEVYHDPLNAAADYVMPIKPGDLNRQTEVNGKSFTLIRQTYTSQKRADSVYIQKGKTDVRVARFNGLVVPNGNYFILAGAPKMTERKGNANFNPDELYFPEQAYTARVSAAGGIYAADQWVSANVYQIRNEMQKIVFNSEFDPGYTATVYMHPEFSTPRVAGRVIDSFTNLGASRVKIILKPVTQYYNAKKYITLTNTNGYFDFPDIHEKFKEVSEDYNNLSLTVTAPGYTPREIILPRLQYGSQIYQDPILISPGCPDCYGYVADAEDSTQGVTARVKVIFADGPFQGRWVDTYPERLGGSGSNTRGGFLFGSGVLDQMVTDAAMNFDLGYKTPGGIQPDFRLDVGNPLSSGTFGLTLPSGGLSGGSNPGAVPKTPGRGGIKQLPLAIPNLHSLDIDFPANGWLALGGLEVKTDGKGNVVEARLAQGATASDAGMWANYIDAINSANGVSKAGITSGVSDFEKSRQRIGSGTSATPNHMQRFDLPVPKKQNVKIQILPYDRSYLPKEVTLDANADKFLGAFYLEKRKHKIKVELTTPDPQTGMGIAPVGAIVSIDGVEEEKIVDEDGSVYFEFVNNSTSNFTLRVRPQLPAETAVQLQNQLGGIQANFDPGAMHDLGQPTSSSSRPSNVVFVPKTVNFTNVDDNTVRTLHVALDPGAIITGNVTFKETGNPVKNAVVYLEQGQGTNTDIITVTDENGNYRLGGVPIPEPTRDGRLSFTELSVGTSFSDNVHSYVGEIKTIGLQQAEKPVNLQISEIKDMDIRKLLGMPVRLTEAVKEKKGYRISGELVQLPKNENFSESNHSSGARLTFSKVTVSASSLKNQKGVPFAVPAGENVILNNKSYSIKVFDVFNAKVSSPGKGSRLPGSNERLVLSKTSSDTSGSLVANVRIVDNSFNFPSSYMTISNADFYMGNYGMDTAASGKLMVPIFKSEEYPLTRFSISNKQKSGIEFNYLGFDGTTGNSGARESYVLGDSVNLYLDLHATLQGGIDLSFNAGKAVIAHDRMMGVFNEDTLRFDIDKWEVKSESWQLSPQSGGIVLNNGTLNTGLVSLPFADMTILPGEPEAELLSNSLDATAIKRAAEQGKLTLGGGAVVLGFYDGLSVTFGYDPDVGSVPGEGHYKFSLQSPLGKVAYFGGLDGMTDAGQRLNIQYLSTLSNGEQLFAFDGNMKPVTFYNQLHFVPQRLFNFENSFTLSGLMNMDVPAMPKDIGLDFKFDYTGNDDIRNKASVGAINFAFTGNGGSRFQVNSDFSEAQQIDHQIVALPGIVSLPQGNQKFNANFVSVVYEGQKPLIPATGKVDIAYRSGQDNNYAYHAAGGVQSASLFHPTGSMRIPYRDILAPQNGGRKISAEVYIGTPEQLFGENRKFLTGKSSGMRSYGSGTFNFSTGNIDFNDEYLQNDLYNSTSGIINNVSTEARQLYNNMLNQVGSLKSEIENAHNQFLSKINSMGADAEQALQSGYGEILSKLEELEAHGNDLYNEVLTKRAAFLNYGNELYNKAYNDMAGGARSTQAEVEAMFRNLTEDIANSLNGYQSYASNVLRDISGKANALRGMGDDIYDGLYSEVSGLYNHLDNYANNVRSNVAALVGDLQQFGIQTYIDSKAEVEALVAKGRQTAERTLAEVNGLLSQAENSINDLEGQINDLISQGKGAYANAQREMLQHWKDLRAHGNNLRNELEGQVTKWTNLGRDIANGLKDDVASWENYGRELYNEMQSELIGKADDVRTYINDLAKGVEGHLNDLYAKGKQFYDDTFKEFSDGYQELYNLGEGIVNDVAGWVSDYGNKAVGYFDDMSDALKDKKAELESRFDGMMQSAQGMVDDVVQYGEDFLNAVLEGPVGDALNALNDLKSTADQYITMGKQKVEDLMGEWPLAGDAVKAFQNFDGNDIEGSLLRIAGDMVDFDGIKENAKDKLMMVANETIDGLKETLEVDQISEGISDMASSDVFKGMNIDIDFNTGRIIGSMYTDFISFGAVELSQLGIEVLLDRSGWYLYTGAGVDMPTTAPLNPIIFPIGVGVLIGSYGDISPALESRVVQHSFVGRLPNPIKRDGIRGFFLTGRKDILKPTKVSVDFWVVDFEVGASAGLDARLLAHFGPANTNSFELGMMAFADAYARLSVLGGTCGVRGSAAANLGITAAFQNNPTGPRLTAAACASVMVSGSAWCAFVSGGFSESILATMNLCTGSGCTKGVTFHLSREGSCSDGSSFDY